MVSLFFFSKIKEKTECFAFNVNLHLLLLLLLLTLNCIKIRYIELFIVKQI